MLKKKVCLVGSFGVGKTSLVAQFVSGIFSDKYLTTIGVKIDKKLVSLEGGDLQLLLWDMAGEERFEHLQTSYLRGASGLIFVADGTREETLDRAVEYAGEVAAMEPGAVPIVLVNKADLTADWEVGGEAEVAERVGGLPFVLTSAKTGENVEEAFVQLCEGILSNHGE